MKLKNILIAFGIFITFSSTAGSGDKIRLYENNRRIYNGLSGAAGETQINTTAKGIFTVIYSGKAGNTSRRSILIFDNERHELLRKDIDNSYGRFYFNIDTLKAKSNGRPFQIYTTAIPKDPNEAAVVRMRPLLLCTVGWAVKTEMR